MRRIASWLSAAALVAGASSVAFALKNEEFQGKPSKFTPGKLNTGVWHDDDGLHVRFSTAGKVDRTYSGKICAEKILKADGHELEPADKLEVGEGENCIFFTFQTDGAVDGIDFRADGAGITFDLQIDGKPIPKDDIFIGAGNRHPKMQQFVLNRM